MLFIYFCSDKNNYIFIIITYLTAVIEIRTEIYKQVGLETKQFYTYPKESSLTQIKLW